MLIFQNVSSFFVYYAKKWTNFLLYKELAHFFNIFYYAFK